MIVGNKKDQEESRVVEMTEAAKFAQENGIFIDCVIVTECLFMETSAMTGENIEELFTKMTNTIVYKIESGEIPDDLIMQSKQIKSLSSS